MKPNRLLLGLLTTGLVFAPASVTAQTTPAAAPAKKAEPTPTTAPAPAAAPKSADPVEAAKLNAALRLDAVEVLGISSNQGGV